MNDYNTTWFEPIVPPPEEILIWIAIEGGDSPLELILVPAYYSSKHNLYFPLSYTLHDPIGPAQVHSWTPVLYPTPPDSFKDGVPTITHGGTDV